MMETTLIITANVIFLTWLYIQQKRLKALERQLMDWYKLSQTPKYIETQKRLTDRIDEARISFQKAAESFKSFGEQINDVLKNQSEL